MENIVLECPFPKSVLNVTLTPNQGKYSFDPTTKLMTWDIGRLDPTKTPNIKGTVSIFMTSLYFLFIHFFLDKHLNKNCLVLVLQGHYSCAFNTYSYLIH